MSDTNYKDAFVRLPESFYTVFCSELVAINGIDILAIDPDCESCRAVDYIVGTSGWNIALWSACKRLDCMWFYSYYDSLRWFESDEFDSDLSDELVKRIEDPEGEAGYTAYYLYLMAEKEKDEGGDADAE